MTEDEIKKLLQKADQTAGSALPVPANLTATVRRRANRRHFANIVAPLAAAAVLLIAFGVWHITSRTAQITQDKDKIASLEAQIQQLQARTDATLNLIQEVVDYGRKQRRLDELQAQLASIPDPLEEIQKQSEKTAFYIVYNADHMYSELGQKDSAIQAYNQVIRLFPKTRSAEVAKQRLSEIQNNSVNKKDLKI